jgi:hypothetical protein
MVRILHLSWYNRGVGGNAMAEMNYILSHPPLPRKLYNAKGAFLRLLARVQEFSSVGRASVSKTEGRGFESPNSCHYFYSIIISGT